MITQQIVQEHLQYNGNGTLTWKKYDHSKHGQDASYPNNYNGFRKVKLLGKDYQLHRLIFLYHNGFLPEMVEHIDGNITNNKIENLRVLAKSKDKNYRKPFSYLDVKDYFHYNNGILEWKIKKGPAKKGDKAGRTHPKTGEAEVSLNQQKLAVKRLVWMLHNEPILTNRIPQGAMGSITHLNGNRQDNSIYNLCEKYNGIEYVYDKIVGFKPR